MAKRRKKRRPKSQPRKASRKAVAALAEVKKLLREGNNEEAKAILVGLVARYPGNKPILIALHEASLESEDWTSVARYGEQLYQLEKGTDRAETLNNVIYAYVQLNYPALARQASQELINNHPDFSGIEGVKLFDQSNEALLTLASESLLKTAAVDSGDTFDILVQHDRVRLFTETGQVDKAISAAESLLETAPNLIPVRNNLSLSHFLAGNTEQAIAIGLQVLAQEPENYHTLANLTRFSFLTAQFEVAHEYAARLKEIRGDDVDLEVKQAEALSFLGDDVGVRDAYQRARDRLGEPSPLLLHLAAAAHYRLGEEKSAWRLWADAVEAMPSLGLAQENLDDRRLPPGEGETPWYWSFQYWLPGEFHNAFERRMVRLLRGRSERAIVNAARKLLNDFPYVVRLFPHILDRGDHHARSFVINFIGMTNPPGSIDGLLEFAQGRYGSDNLRMEAIQFINQEHPDKLPKDKLVPMWQQGRQTEIMLMDFEVYHETEPPVDLADDVMDKHEEAYDFLMAREPEEAERLLREVIAAAPDIPSPYNHLALAYDMQGKRKKSRALVKETHARFPDYLFARVALARMYVLEERIQEAKDMVAPLLQCDRLHISEFRALVQAQMEIALAQDQKEGARTWLNMWMQVEDDHPDQLGWRFRIEGEDGVMRRLSKLLG